MSHAVTHLYLAYVATWVIHIVYLLLLGSKARKVRQEARELSDAGRG